MKEQINELKRLREEVAHWEEQKYYDDQAKQEVMMDGRQYDQSVTDRIITEMRKAQGNLSTFEMYNFEVVEALEEIEATEAKSETEAAIKSAWNN